MIRALAVCLAGAGLSLPGLAQQNPPAGDALQLLQRVLNASQKLSYTGTFVYRSGNRSEVSRITHVAEGGDELERLETIEGTPREVVRQNDEVRCYLPESRMVIVERRGPRRSFPVLLPASVAGLTEYYVIRKGPSARVAGLESQALLIEPKDEFRYGRQLWVDLNSGLLLKAGLVDDAGRPLETFAFTELRIGGSYDRAAIWPNNDNRNSEWQVLTVRATEARTEEGQWQFRNTLPGFRRLPGMKRQLRPDAPESMHVVFSDGLAAVSVFIEPVTDANRADNGLAAVGPLAVVKRHVGDYRLVVMGDVPPAALQRFAEGIEPRRR